MDDDLVGSYGQIECEDCLGSGLDRKFCDGHDEYDQCDCEVECKCVTQN